MITTDQLSQIIPHNKEPHIWTNFINEFCEKYGINTPIRLAAFLAQTAHESADYTQLHENLNYSAAQLVKTWPKRFTSKTAAAYAKKPEKIANKVYANRMGNGSEASGDGYKFRGRGLIQLTGKDNYTQFGSALNMTAEQATDYCSTQKGAFESGCWYWRANNLNKFADADDIVGMTEAINGGTIGLVDRKEKYELAKAILKSEPTGRRNMRLPPTVETLRKGSKGPNVIKLQNALHITADGDFGAGTETALKKWQASNGLTADGIAGPNTLSKLYK